MRFWIAILCLPILVLTGCGGSSSSNTTPGALSGNWQMSLQKDNSNANPKTQSGFLLQQNASVSGNLTLKANICSGVGGVSGTTKGNNVALVVSPTGLTVNLAGTVGTDQASMGGNYTILGSGCAGPGLAPETGTWTANLVKPFNGNMAGTFTSNNVGTAFTVTGQVSQAKNPDANSTALLSGNLTVNGYCFGPTTISGSIGGTQVVMNLVTSDGTQVATIDGTSSLDGTLLAGVYHVVPQGPSGTPPCASGDGGSVSLTVGQ
jgi:hypothetical protein